MINNISAAVYLLKNQKFEYVLPSFFSQESFETFWQARQRFGNYFCIDVNDVIVAGEVQSTPVRQTSRHPNKDGKVVPQCFRCEDKFREKEVDLVKDFQVCVIGIYSNLQVLKSTRLSASLNFLFTIVDLLRKPKKIHYGINLWTS